MQVETGLLIDNSSGVLNEVDILLRLNSFAESIGSSKLTPEEITEVEETRWEDRLQIAYEVEIDLIERINEVLLQQDLCITVGEVEPGVYLIEEVLD